MSRFTRLDVSAVAAVFSTTDHYARRIINYFAPLHLIDEKRPKVSAVELEEYCEKERVKRPPLLVALLADEREYPVWLTDLVGEWKQVQGRLRKPRGAKLKLEKAQTWEEATAIAEQFPSLEARGYLDEEGLPPEFEMADRWGMAKAGGNDD